MHLGNSSRSRQEIPQGLPACRNWGLIGLCGLVILCIGCARKPPRAQVSGVVTYQGEPVPLGDIVFEPVDGWKEFYCQGEIVNGKYEFKKHGPVVGKNRVEIHGYRQTNEVVPDVSGKRLDDKPAMTHGLIPYIPVEHNTSSQITVEIVAGENLNVDFHLK